MSVERSWRKVCFLPPPSSIVSDSSVSVWPERQRLPCCGNKAAVISSNIALAAHPPKHLPLQADPHARQPSTESSVKLRVMNYNVLGASLVSFTTALECRLQLTRFAQLCAASKAYQLPLQATPQLYCCRGHSFLCYNDLT